MIFLPRSCSGTLHYDWTNEGPVCAWYDAWGVKQRLSAGFRLKLPIHRHTRVCVCVLGCACLSLCLVIAVAFRCGPIRIISATLTPSIFFRLKSSWILVATPALFIFFGLAWVRNCSFSSIFYYFRVFWWIFICSRLFFGWIFLFCSGEFIYGSRSFLSFYRRRFLYLFCIFRQLLLWIIRI